MKKNILFYFLLFTAFNTTAQKWYYGVAAGYGYNLASTNITSIIDNSIIQTRNKNVKGSFGRGINVDGFLGINLNNNFALETKVSYFMGSKFKGANSKQSDFTENMDISANMLKLSPCLRINIGEGKFKPYVRFGATFKLLGNITTQDSYQDLKNNISIESNWKYTKGFSAGFNGALGSTVKLSNNIFLFGEISIISQSWGPKKGKCKKYIINGVDNLEKLTPNQKDIDFSDDYTTTGNYVAQTAYAARQMSRQYFPFSSVGINIGIQIAIKQRDKKQ